MPTWAISCVLLILIGHLLEFGGDVFDGLLDAFLHVDGVDARGHGLEAFVEDGFGQDGGGGGAVAGDVAGFAGDFLHHLGAHVLVGVFELNFLGDGDAVFGDGRRAEGFLEDDVAALGAERDFDGPGQFLNAATHGVAGFLIEGNHFCHGWTPWCSKFVLGKCCAELVGSRVGVGRFSGSEVGSNSEFPGH